MGVMPILLKAPEGMLENLHVVSVGTISVDEKESTDRRTHLDAIIQRVSPVLVFFKTNRSSLTISHIQVLD
jgi:hypothetical protein